MKPHFEQVNPKDKIGACTELSLAHESITSTDANKFIRSIQDKKSLPVEFGSFLLDDGLSKSLLDGNRKLQSASSTNSCHEKPSSQENRYKKPSIEAIVNSNIGRNVSGVSSEYNEQHSTAPVNRNTDNNVQPVKPHAISSFGVASSKRPLVEEFPGDSTPPPKIGDSSVGSESTRATGDSNLEGAISRPGLSTGRVILDTNFKSLDGFSVSGNRALLTSGDAAHPTVARMVLDRNSSSVPYRTELAANSSAETLKFGHQYSIKFTDRLVDWKKDSSPESIFQLHAIPAGGWPEGSGQGGHPDPKVGLIVKDGQYHFSFGKKEIWSGPAKEGEWNDWEIRMRVDAGTNKSGQGGYLDLYQNGKRVASTEGVNAIAKGSAGDAMKPEVYAKIGIYKWEWRDGRPATDTNRRVIDFSNFRISELPG